VRIGESRRVEYPFTKYRGKLSSRVVSKTANLGVNSVNPFNDKANGELIEG
jgi:hypothetical protein